MLRFSANLSWLFPELPFAERIQQAIAAGFAVIEFGFPHRCDLDAVRAAHAERGLQVALFNLDVSVWDATLRGYLVDPAWRDELDRKLNEALALAQGIGCTRINLPVGNEMSDRPRAAQRDCIVDNLRRLAPRAESAGVTLLIESLNPFDNPGYFLTTSSEGFEIVRAVDRPNVKFQFDTYHVQLMEGNLISRLEKNLELIGHIQVADVPGRHQPGTGEINFANVFAALERLGYDGFIGLEYRPAAELGDPLAWLPREKRG